MAGGGCREVTGSLSLLVIFLAGWQWGPMLLGIPPYIVPPFSDVLAEFGVQLPEDTEVRVWDSTAELRYLVMPQRPAGTEGLEESALAELVTRNGMIGTALL